MSEKIVYDPTPDRQKAKGKKKDPQEKTDEKLHEAELAEKPKPKKEPEKKEPEAFINKYGFLHVDKDLAKYLNLKLGKDQKNTPVTIERIEGGFIVKLGSQNG